LFDSEKPRRIFFSLNAQGFLSVISAMAYYQQHTRRTPLLLSINGTDRRTLDRFIDPAAHTASVIFSRRCVIELLHKNWPAALSELPLRPTKNAKDSAFNCQRLV